VKVEIIEKVLAEGRTVLSEHESKQLLKEYGIPVTREVVVEDRHSLVAAAGEIGFPLVLKGCGPHLSHKTERSLVDVDLRSETEAVASFDRILAEVRGEGGAVLVQEMIRGSRELVAGLTRDAQFGPCVMFGLGGIFAEVLKDISFRVAPLEKRDALEMMQEIRARKILQAVRGMPPADLDRLAQILVRLGEIGLEHDAVKEIDINPILLDGSRPVAVDALVVLQA
jgi:acetyl-CoA synthetase (ADP-forming)